MAIQRSFSIATLLLWTLIIALTLSNIVAAWRLADIAEINDELKENRRRYGYITVTDPAKTYVSEIEAPEEPWNTSLRVRVPKGSWYLLHLSDASFDEHGPPADLQPTETISLNGWRDGAEAVLTYSIQLDKGRPRIVVRSEAQGLFDYVPPDWGVSDTGEEWTEGWMIDAQPQLEYSIDETIRLTWFRNAVTGRGLVLWLEPFSTWNERRLAAENKAKRADYEKMNNE